MELLLRKIKRDKSSDVHRFTHLELDLAKNLKLSVPKRIETQREDTSFQC